MTLKNKGVISPKVVGTFHACGGGSERFLLRCLSSYFKRFVDEFDHKIAVSQASMDFISPVLPGDYSIIPNGVDVQRFIHSGKKLTGFDDGVINLLFVGRLEPRKGLTNLLRSLPLIKKLTKQEFRLIIVGNGLLTPYYKSKVPKVVQNQVTFVGDVSFEDLPDYYATADIFCSPATYGESFGIVLIEAMASGLPVVAGDNEGYRKVIKNNVSGILVDPEDTFEMAHTISRLIESDIIRKRLAQKSRVFAIDYSWSKIVDKMELVYSSCMRNNGNEKDCKSFI